MSVNRPGPFTFVWAENGETWDLPESGADHNDGRADIQTGFPKQTMISVINGGVPPYGRDHNTILNRITKDLQWIQAGGFPVFDQALCNKIGGYPAGTILQHGIPKLQGSNLKEYITDPETPWVFWMNLVDGNTNDPNKNEIDAKSPMNGWVRYPVISGADGSSLYYDKQGRLEIASATVNLNRWVSSSAGSDTEGNGTKENPYFSINKALNDTPGSGAVTIYIRDKDTHYWSPDGTATQTEGGWIYIGSRQLQIRPYDYDYENPDESKRDTKIYDTIERDMQDHISDGTGVFCLSQDTLNIYKIARPTLILVWKYHESLVETGWTVTGMQFCCINGVSNEFALRLFGIKIVIDRISEFTDSALDITTGWGWNGGNYQFVGCVFGSMPKPLYKKNDPNSRANQYLLGGGGDHATTYSFPYRNFFEDEDLSTVLISYPSNLSINATSYSDGDEYDMLDTEKKPMGYKIMKGNANQFLSRSSVYGNGLDLLKNPTNNSTDSVSYTYAFIKPNFEIK